VQFCWYLHIELFSYFVHTVHCFCVLHCTALMLFTPGSSFVIYTLCSCIFTHCSADLLLFTYSAVLFVIYTTILILFAHCNSIIIYTLCYFVVIYTLYSSVVIYTLCSSAVIYTLCNGLFIYARCIIYVAV